jgi:Protein of unknown function (DUF669)
MQVTTERVRYMPGLNLNLSGADLKGFEPLPAGTYDASVYEVSMKETKGGDDAKLPGGTPMLNVQFKIDGGDYDNRRVFRSFIIAPDKIGGKKYEKKAMFDGMLARFFMALGYDESEVVSDDFDPDFEDLVGKECRVTLSVNPGNEDRGWAPSNDVKAVRPRSEATAGSALL